MANTTTRIYELQVKLAAESLAQLKKLQGHVGGIEKQFLRAEDSLKQFGAGLIGAAGFSAFVSMVTQSVQAMDQMATSAERLGLSTDSFQAMAYSAAQADVQIGELETGLKFLQKAIVEANDKTSKAGKLFAALGVSTAGKSTEQVLFETADAISKIGDESVRTAAQLEIFGKTGTALTAWLDTGSAGMKNLMERARDLGAVIDAETLASISKFDNSMKDVQAVTGAAAKNITAGMLPAMQKLAEAFINGNKDANAWKTVGATIGDVMVSVAKAAAYAAGGIKQLGLAASWVMLQIANAKGGSVAWADISEQIGEKMRESALSTQEFVDQISSSTTVTTENTGAVKENNAALTGRARASLASETATKKNAAAEKWFREEMQKATAELNARKSLVEEGARLTEQLRTPLERYGDEIKRIQRLSKEGVITPDTANRAVVKADMDLIKELGTGAEETKEELQGMDKLMAEVASNTDEYAKDVAGMFVDFATGADGASRSFEDFAMGVLRNLAQMATQILVVEPLMRSLRASMQGAAASGGGGVGGLLKSAWEWISNAKGGVYSSPSLSAYSNQVHTSPKVFAFAKGAGIFAEDGAEAIMPLKRGADGSLGVEASGGGGGDVIINVINESKAEVETRATTNVDGKRMVEMWVRDAVTKGFSSGSFDGIMGSTYGLNRRGAF